MSIKPLKVLQTPEEKDSQFISSGVSSKPPGCSSCQFRFGGSGFVADYVPRDPKVALILAYPSADDVMEQRPWAGKAGWAWTKTFLEPVGLKRGDCLISHILRCVPKGWPQRYPTGPTKRSAELSCRQFDNSRFSAEGIKTGGLLDFDPNLFMATFHPQESRIVPALQRLIISDLRRAVAKTKEGYRVCVLMGTETMELVWPWTIGSGGVKAWRGHWTEGYWPWKAIGDNFGHKMFEAPSISYERINAKFR